MMMELNALHVKGSEIDYKKMGMPVPDDVLSFSPVWVNLAHIETIDNHPKYPKECVITLISGKSLQVEITQMNLLALMDAANLLYPAEKFLNRAS